VERHATVHILSPMMVGHDLPYDVELPPAGCDIQMLLTLWVQESITLVGAHSDHAQMTLGAI